MNPRAALEQKGLLRDRIMHPRYQEYMTAFQDDVRAKGNGPTWLDERNRVSGYSFAVNECRRLDLSETYYVAEEMVPLILAAAAGLEPADCFGRTLWPTDYGFLYFAQGLTILDQHGRVMVIKAVTWGRHAVEGHPGMVLTCYTDIEDPRDDFTPELVAEFGTARLLKDIGRLQVNHLDWFPDEAQAGSGELARLLLAVIMLLGQTVTSVEQHQVDRHTARRLRRMRVPDRVTVVRLRRTRDTHAYAGETLVEWQHRWIVRGHWRNQPYRGEGGTAEYRRIWVSAYVKGPEGLPLKQSEKVYSLER